MMNTQIKNLIIEILSYSEAREGEFQVSHTSMKKAIEKLGSTYRYRSSDLLSLIDPVRHNEDRASGKYVFYDDEFMTEDILKEIYDEFVLLFQYVPELKELFVLKEKHIEFNSNLSKSDIQELTQIVLDFYKANPRRATFLRKPYLE